MNEVEQVRRLLDRAAESVEPGPLPRIRRTTRRRTALTAGVGVAAAAAAGVALGGFLAPTRVTPPADAPKPTASATRTPLSPVPDVVGLEYLDAVARLTDAGFTGVLDPDHAAPEAACSSSVTSMSPDAGASAEKGASVLLRLAHEPCLVGTHTLTGDLRRLTAALQGGRVDDVPLAPVVRLTQEGGPATVLRGPDRTVPDNWVVWSNNPQLPLHAAYDQAVVDGTPLSCTGSVEALPDGETTRPDLTYVAAPGTDENGEQKSCLAWSAVDLWLDDDGALRHLHLRTWE